jgi:hypothetical protein
LLSDGQRKLSTARLAAAKAGDDLREFDLKLKAALVIKFSLLAHQQTQDRLLDVLHGKAAVLDRLLHDSDQLHCKAKQGLQNAMQLEETLRLDIRKEFVNQQRIADQTSKAADEVSAYQQNLEMNVIEETSLQRQIEDLEKEDSAWESHDIKTRENFLLHQEEHQKFHVDMSSEHERLKQLIAEKNTRLHHFWHEAVNVQKSEGHAPCPLPSESIVPPVIDLQHLHNSLNAETAAVTEEADAKVRLAVSVQELQKHLTEVQCQYESSRSCLGEHQTINFKSSRIEEERQVLNAQVVAKYDGICKAIDEKTETESCLRSEREIEISEKKKVLNILTQQVHEAMITHQDHCNEIYCSEDEIRKMKEKRDELLENNRGNLKNMEDELVEIRLNIKLLQDSTEIRGELSSTSTTVPMEELSRRKEIDAASVKISNFLEGTQSKQFLNLM